MQHLQSSDQLRTRMPSRGIVTDRSKMAVKVTKENPEGTKKTAFFLRDLFKKQGVRARRIQSPGAALRQPCMNRTTRNRDTDREESG